MKSTKKQTKRLQSCRLNQVTRYASTGAKRIFVWKKIGNEFVKNISYAAERIIHRAEAMKLNTVLLLTNDPEVYPEEKRHEGRVKVNTLRGMLHEMGGLRVEKWSMHRNLPDRSKAIYIDKATCSMMVDFIGTAKVRLPRPLWTCVKRMNCVR